LKLFSRKIPTTGNGGKYDPRRCTQRRRQKAFTYFRSFARLRRADERKACLLCAARRLDLRNQIRRLPRFGAARRRSGAISIQERKGLRGQVHGGHFEKI